MKGKEELNVICIKVVVKREEMRVLGGVMYMMKSRGPRTEPWGTLQKEVYREGRLCLHLTLKQQDDE